MFKPEVLKEELKKQNLPNMHLAAMLGVSRSTVTKWLKGVALPKQATIKRIERVLELPEGLLVDSEIQVIYNQLNHADQEKLLMRAKELLKKEQGGSL